jgi:hypothetical protein
MNSRTLGLYIAVATVLVAPAFATIGSGYTLSGKATFVMPGETSNQAVNLTSACPSGSPACLNDGSLTFAGIDIAVPAGLTFSGISHLIVNFKITEGDCGGGSPRFQINIGTASLFVYLGPVPAFTGCQINTWTSSGDVIASTDGRFDGSQLASLGGYYGMTYAQALAVLGSQTVTGIQLVVDGGWFAPPTQTVLVDNLVFNSSTFTFEPTTKDACKDGGWVNFTFAPGPFKNQGDCVSYFATEGKNEGGKNVPRKKE